MITSEVKTANKKFRIYRPDISLDEICRTNGPAIVRKMIPCFDFPEDIYDDKYEIVKIFKRGPRKGQVVKKLVKKGNNVFTKYRFSFVYGVNVRTPRVDRILPFSTAYVFDKSKGEGHIKNDLGIVPQDIKLKVPSFTDDYRIRELFLYADIKKGRIASTSDIIILSLTTEETLDIKRFRRLKKDIARQDGFFLKQVNALGIKERAYLWLTSEDYNVNTAGEALSNIIAISDDYDAISKNIIPHRLDFINLLFLIKARYLFDMEDSQRKTAIASAKAAIMSRNMSHNLGSHVMAYLKQHLNSVQDMVRDNVLDSIIKSDDDLSTPEGLQQWFNRFEESQQGLSNVALPFLVGLGKFISYLQERQDFIATIATDYVPYFSTVNFKDFVYDELNPDLRYLRHPDRIGLKPDNILLGNIARSEGLARSTMPTENKKSQMSDIILKYKNFDGNPVDVTELGYDDLKDMRDFMVSLPGGVVGRQAIFSIVENVIRNAAKHGKWGNEVGNNLELSFNRYYLEDYTKNRLIDDFVPKGDDKFKEFFRKYYAAASDINDLCVITLTDNMPFEQYGTSLKKCENLDSIRKALIEPYIDNASVEMLQTNKGIKEMRISAAWLRGVEDDVKINPLYINSSFSPEKSKDKEDHWIYISPDPEMTPEQKKEFVYKYWNPQKDQWVGKAPVLMVRACAEKDKEDYHLQYVFCLPRPKEVAVIFSNEEYDSWANSNDESSVKDWFAQNAWGVFSVDSFIREKNKSYEFVLVSQRVNIVDIEKIVQLSPRRVYTQKQISSIIRISDSILTVNFRQFSTVYVSLYRLLSAFNAKTDRIYVSDKKVKPGKTTPKYVIIDEGVSQGRYIYRTHNETEQNFTKFIKSASNKTLFVEGITGNNSTDRLIRNDRIDELWLYRHLHAMKTSVGIFDERIFSKVFKKDEADIRMAKLPFEKLKKQICDSISDYKLRRKVSKAQDEDELKALLGRNPREVLGDYMSIAFEKKGVSIFNMLKTDKGVEIYGYAGETWDDKGQKCYGVIKQIGDITWKVGEDDDKGHFVINNHLGLKYNYLSIHQGLLDKVYEKFSIRNDAAAKHDFTKAFYCAFSKDPHYLCYKDASIQDTDKEGKTVFFLPNLRIHSGRSKPSFADMPQHQPFIQYAAIEHAVMDCKYSLIELLDFARYE